MVNSNNGILIHSSNVVKFITPNLESICTYLNDSYHQNVAPHAIASLYLMHQGGGKKQILRVKWLLLLTLLSNLCNSNTFNILRVSYMATTRIGT